jgi:hypothetical protein
VKIGKLIIERKSDAEIAAEYRRGAATIRRGGLGRLGEHEAKRADRLAAKHERKARADD